MENSLPKSWVECKFGDIAKIQNGYAFPSKDFRRDKGVPLIKQSQLDGDKVFLDKCIYLDEKYLETKKDFVLKKGDILIGMSGSIGKMCIYDLDFPALQNQRTGKVIPLSEAHLSKKLFWYFLSTIERKLIDKGKGLGVTNVSADDIEDLDFALAPLPEQHRIVAKLDELMEKTERSKKRLEKIPLILKRFRQSVLAAAVSGKLTEEWREKNKIKEEWEEKTLIDVITEKPKNGYSAKPVNYETPYRVITLTATTSGKFISKHFKYFDEKIKSDSQFWIQPNDILIQRGNTIEYVGVSAIYDGEPNELIYPDLMMRVRANKLIQTKYLYFVLSDEKSRNFLRDRATGTAGNMPKINQPTLMSLPIQLPSIKEQHEIVRRVEALFAFADKIETRYTKAKAQFDKLPQALLAKAFKGELVEQDAGDESASILLERIRKEKTTSSAKGGHSSLKKGGKGKKKKEVADVV